MLESDEMTFERFERRGSATDDMVAIFRLRRPMMEYYYTATGYEIRQATTRVYNRESLADRIKNLVENGHDASLSKSVLAQMPF